MYVEVAVGCKQHEGQGCKVPAFMETLGTAAWKPGRPAFKQACWALCREQASLLPYACAHQRLAGLCVWQQTVAGHVLSHHDYANDDCLLERAGYAGGEGGAMDYDDLYNDDYGCVVVCMCAGHECNRSRNQHLAAHLRNTNVVPAVQSVNVGPRASTS
eukprot:scaffold17382_cov20-Tisochrysis_lutea.AAC.4